VKNNTKIYAEVLEDEALEQFNKAMNIPYNAQGALMPDAHTGYTLPIGSVIKSKGRVFPAYVGYDIGCGMCAVKLNITKDDIDLVRLKEHILKTIPVGFNRQKEPSKLNQDTSRVSNFLVSLIKPTAEYQIGTLGGGNHFIEIGESENDKKLWIVVHSGSRGLGHKVASHYMEAAAINSIDEHTLETEFRESHKNLFDNNSEAYKKSFEKYLEKHKVKTAKHSEGHYSFDINSEHGKQYLADMNFCLNYALDNRKTMIARIYEGIFNQKVCKMDMENFINRNHNHAELKDDFVIHRKGATHAENGMLGVIPANMRDGSFIVRGLGNSESLFSSSHGAGRVLSRKQAKKTLDKEEFRREMAKITTNHTDETIDESPLAYKNINEVMALQKDLVEVIDRVRPILNIKG
jgi:tRNA-splicing ligase RtcB